MRSTITALLLGIVLGGISVSLVRQPEAQAQKAGALEYKAVWMSMAEPVSAQDGTTKEASKLGSQGWEYVGPLWQNTDGNKSGTMAMFKRGK